MYALKKKRDLADTSIKQQKTSKPEGAYVFIYIFMVLATKDSPGKPCYPLSSE